MNVTVPHWAIDEALKRVNEHTNHEYRSWSADMVLTYAKGNDRYAVAIVHFAEMIAKYEPHLEPEDPLLLAEAREMGAQHLEELGLKDGAAHARAGYRDQYHPVKTILRAIRRGKELAR